jgi:hypothetical protein
MASNGTETPLLPGQSPPLSVLTPTDQTGVVLIATALGLVFAVVSLLIRYFIRVDLQNKVAADDILATLALVCELGGAKWTVLMRCRYSQLRSQEQYSWKLQKGLGRRLRMSQWNTLWGYRRYGAPFPSVVHD